MEHQDLVPAVPQEAKGLEGQIAVEQQVGDEHHQPAATELVHHPAERGLRRGPQAGLEVAQDREQLSPVAEPCPGRKHGPDVVIERDEPGGVALAQQDQRERRDQPLGVAQLGKALSGLPVQAIERLASHTTIARRLVSSSNCFT